MVAQSFNHTWNKRIYDITDQYLCFLSFILFVAFNFWAEWDQMSFFADHFVHSSFSFDDIMACLDRIEISVVFEIKRQNLSTTINKTGCFLSCLMQGNFISFFYFYQKSWCKPFKNFFWRCLWNAFVWKWMFRVRSWNYVL